MPAPTIIELTEQERKEFHRLCRSGKTPVRLKERLSIVLLADKGLSNVAIAQFVPIFSLITEKAIKRGVFGSVKKLEAKLMQFIDQCNENNAMAVTSANAAMEIAKKKATSESILRLARTK